MKKFFIAAALTAAAVVSASADDILVTWCGKQIYVIDVGNLPEDFSPQDVEEYYQDLNVALCGSEGGYQIIHD